MTPEWPKVMAAYNTWMNERLLALLADLSDDERKRDRGAFFGSIHGTLNHLLFGDLMWMARFLGRERPRLKMGEMIHEDFADLRAARTEMDVQIVAWAEAVDHVRQGGVNLGAVFRPPGQAAFVRAAGKAAPASSARPVIVSRVR